MILHAQNYLIENADPAALIGDKTYDADPFVDALAQRVKSLCASSTSPNCRSF
jgi:hypothetical protein